MPGPAASAVRHRRKLPRPKAWWMASDPQRSSRYCSIASRPTRCRRSASRKIIYYIALDHDCRSRRRAAAARWRRAGSAPENLLWLRGR